jgi:hypothetical protein
VRVLQYITTNDNDRNAHDEANRTYREKEKELNAIQDVHGLCYAR